MSVVSKNVASFPNTTLTFPNISNSVLQNTISEDPIVCTWHLPTTEGFKIAMTTLGFLGNGLTFVIIALKKDLHSKTFAVISVTALSDFLYCLGVILWVLFYYAYRDIND